jgi:hypothetical protein
MAFRMDATGLRIGAASGIGTTNTVGFETPGSVKFTGYGSGSKTGTATFNLQVDASGNLIEGSATLTNPMTTLGDLNYGGASGVFTRLAGNTTTLRKFLVSQGASSLAQAPTLDVLTSADIPNNAANTSGTAANLSGTPGLPSGTTATTQSSTDNTTKVATTAFVQSIVASGIYTPTITNGANVTSNSSAQAHYVKSGSEVSVDGSVTITPTLATTSTDFQISIPIGTNTFSNGIQGTGLGGTKFTDPVKPWIISTVSATTVTVTFTPAGTGGQVIYFHFVYTIQ